MAGRTARSSLGTISAEALRAELNRREHGARRLEKQHARLVKKLRKLEDQMASYGGRTSGGGRRARNKQSLVDVLAQVLKGKTMGVPEAADAVLATGYTSNAANFRLIVNQALIKSERFKKVSRGQYTAK
jgi:hypothetical protein